MKKKSSVFKKIVLSYLIIIIIPIILTTIMQMSVFSTINKGIIDENVVALNLLRNELDKSFVRLGQLSYSLALSNETNSFTNDFAGRERYTDFLKTQRGIYKDVDVFAIYFKDYDVIMSSTGYYDDIKNFYDVYYSGFDISYEQFCDDLLDRTNSSYMFLKNAKNGESGLTYVLPLDFDASLCNGCVIASIPSDRYALLLEKMEKDLNSSIIISNKNNDYFLGNGALGDINLKSLSANSGIEEITINGKKTVLCYVASEITGWKYISGKPASVFWAKRTFITALWIITLILCALLGCVMIVFLSKQNYNPIKNIVDKIEAYSTDKEETDEFAKIETAISSMSQKYNDLNSYLKSQEKNLRNVCLMNLLRNGIVNPESIFDELSRFDIAFPYENFEIVIAQVINNDSLFGKDGSSLDKVQRQILIDLILSNIMTELFGENHIAVSANIDNRTVVIINTDKSEDATNKVVREALEYLEKTVKKEFSVEVISSVSEMKTGMASLPICYTEAEKTIEAAQMSGESPLIVFYSEFEDKKENTSFAPIREQQLISGIKLGDTESCKKTIREMLSMKNESISSPVLIKYRGYEVAMIMTRLLDTDSVVDEEKNEVYRMLESIEKSKTIGEITTILCAMAEHICTLVSSQEQFNKISISGRVKKLVHENYSDASLSVGNISDSLFLAANYLSRVFKEQTGEGLLEYIQSVRINMAKKMLKETNLTIEKICEETGFSNTNSFQRVFKKVEGVTPGIYRKLNK